MTYVQVAFLIESHCTYLVEVDLKTISSVAFLKNCSENILHCYCRQNTHSQLTELMGCCEDSDDYITLVIHFSKNKLVSCDALQYVGVFCFKLPDFYRHEHVREYELVLPINSFFHSSVTVRYVPR